MIPTHFLKVLPLWAQDAGPEDNAGGITAQQQWLCQSPLSSWSGG